MWSFWVLLAVAAPPATQPDVSATIVSIEHFAAAQHAVDLARQDLYDAIERDPDLLRARQSFDRIKQQLLRVRFRGTTAQLQEASDKYLAAKKAIAAAEADAAPDARTRLEEQAAKLDALRKKHDGVKEAAGK